MTTTQVVETSVTVNNNSPIQDYVHPDDHTQPTYEMILGFKPFTVQNTIKRYKNNGKGLITVLLIRNNDNKKPKKRDDVKHVN